jgi:uncharacterized RDD family membrane protein YckC
MNQATDSTNPAIADINPGSDRLNNVRTSRSLAFVVDAIAIAILMGISSIVIGILGIITFGLGWLLYFIVWPAVALLYYFFTLSQTGATPGMAMFSVELRDADGGKLHPIIGLVHPALFWFTIGFLPLFLISIVVSLLDDKKRMLHDIVLRAIMVRSR